MGPLFTNENISKSYSTNHETKSHEIWAAVLGLGNSNQLFLTG
jgi:hypothetical protein